MVDRTGREKPHPSATSWLPTCRAHRHTGTRQGHAFRAGTAHLGRCPQLSTRSAGSRGDRRRVGRGSPPWRYRYDDHPGSTLTALLLSRVGGRDRGNRRAGRGRSCRRRGGDVGVDGGPCRLSARGSPRSSRRLAASGYNSASRLGAVGSARKRWVTPARVTRFGDRAGNRQLTAAEGAMVVSMCRQRAAATRQAGAGAVELAGWNGPRAGARRRTGCRR